MPVNHDYYKAIQKIKDRAWDMPKEFEEKIRPIADPNDANDFQWVMQVGNEALNRLCVCVCVSETLG
jgi:hypothetical protein